jgi:putative DNA primase/helicase
MSAQPTQREVLPVRNDLEIELQELFEECPRLKTLYSRQKKGTLELKEWRYVMRLLVNAGRVALARYFTGASKKHDYTKDAFIDDIATERPSGILVYCTQLGCEEEKICGPDGCFKKLRYDETGEIVTNSPAWLMLYTFEELIEIGLNCTKRENDSEVEYYFTGKIDANAYVYYIRNNFDIMLHFAGDYYMYLHNVWKICTNNELQRILRFHFLKFEPKWTPKIAGAYMSVLPLDCWRAKEIKPSTYYINLKNGLLNINTLEMEPHNVKVFTTNQLPIEYNKEATCKRFKKYLRTTFGNDRELIDLVQEIIGYCLSYSVKAQKMFIFKGSGSNGKSSLINIITALAGGKENVSGVSLKNFDSRFALSNVWNKTLNISAENESDAHLGTENLQKIVVGDNIDVEIKYKNAFSHTPITKLLFALHNIPPAKEQSFGWERRLIIIPFNKRFVPEPDQNNENEEKLIPGYEEKIIEEELNGVFLFAIEGLKRLMENNYKFTKSGIAELELQDYLGNMNPYLAFFRKFMKIDPEAQRTISRSELYALFHEWCILEEHPKEAKDENAAFLKKFRETLKKENVIFKEDHSDKKYTYSGIRLNGSGKNLYKELLGAAGSEQARQYKRQGAQ